MMRALMDEAAAKRQASVRWEVFKETRRWAPVSLLQSWWVVNYVEGI